MGFRYLAGTTTPGAPDEIIDWFATFQAWIITVGWIVASGAGTTDLVLRSIGEGPPPPLTMLYLHVWRDPGNPNRVKIEVRDDAVGTHETNEAGYLDGAGAQFAFWMCGDRDAINICFLGGTTYHSIYAGLLMPFAQTVLDETYHMIATSLQTTGSILRDSDGVWDVDYNLWDNQIMDDARIDRYDGSFPLCGTFFDAQANIAGQLRHVTGFIEDPAVPVTTVLETGRGSKTTNWIVLQDRNANRYAMRTGGVLPIGTRDPASFTAVTGVAADYAGLWTALTAHLTGLGWTDLGDPEYLDEGRLYFSEGESGEDEIYIGYAIHYAFDPDHFYYYVQDDAVATHRYPTTAYAHLDALNFPINYWICGDRDCCVLVFQRPRGYTLIWSGLVPAFAPGLLPPYAGPPLTVYQLFARGSGEGAMSTGGLLRGHDGAWNQTAYHSDDGTAADNSNANNFDATTYLVWPLLAYQTASGGYELLGQLRYIAYSSGGGVASMDTITVAKRVYTVFFTFDGENFCVRTV